MFRFYAAITFLLCVGFGAGPCQAADRAVIEKRVADAVALFESEGYVALCATAADHEGPFQVDEAYVFAFIRDGRMLCHPRPDLIEQQAGRPSNVPEMLANTEARPSGAWTRYAWPHPETREVGIKSTYCRISGPVIVCAGAFFDVGMV